MKHHRWARLALLAAVAGIGCDASSDLTSILPPAGYPLAFVMNDCAPWDGPAITIVLTDHPLDSLDTAHPQLRVMIYPRGDQLSGRTYRWPSDPEMAAGTRCITADSCEAATAGEITLVAVRPDSAASGRVRLHLASGEDISGGFRAVWLPRRVMCG